MFEDLNPPDWSQFDPNMAVNLSDLQSYYENFTDVVNGQTITNKLALTAMDGRVTKLEQEIPGGGGGTGAFLNLGGDLDNFARIDQSNDFAPFQYIRADNKRVMINGGHEGGSTSPKNSVVPFAPGDSFTQSYLKPGQGEVRNMWIAAIEGDTSSWKRILTDDDPDVVMVNNINHFQTRNQFLGLENDTKRDRVMGSRLNHIGGSVYNGVVPTMFGEVVVCEEWDPQDPSDEDKKVVKAYLAVGTGRKSWLEIGSRLKSALEIIDDGTNN